MSLFLVIVIVILVIINSVLLYLYSKKDKTDNSVDSREIQLLMNQMNEVNRTLQSSQQNINQSVASQFDRSQRLIQDINETVTKHLVDVTRGVTEANEASKQIFTVADSLKNLEQVLKHQKQRGNLGEASLELILSNILPPTAYTIQYNFKNGETVDAAIITKDGIIPVDAKFSLDNYTRIINETDDSKKADLEKEFKNDLKKRIDETAKYIRTEENTLPFAFMFIPAEAIYYDLLINEVGAIKVNTRNLIDYAYNDKKVIIVSPTTFAAYLQSVLYGFRAFKIEESAQEIRKYVGELQKHLKSYEEYHSKLGNALGTVVNHYNQSGKEFKKIDKDVLKITGNSNDITPLQIDKPQKEEY